MWASIKECASIRQNTVFCKFREITKSNQNSPENLAEITENYQKSLEIADCSLVNLLLFINFVCYIMEDTSKNGELPELLKMVRNQPEIAKNCQKLNIVHKFVLDQDKLTSNFVYYIPAVTRNIRKVQEITRNTHKPLKNQPEITDKLMFVHYYHVLD